MTSPASATSASPEQREEQRTRGTRGSVGAAAEPAARTPASDAERRLTESRVAVARRALVGDRGTPSAMWRCAPAGANRTTAAASHRKPCHVAGPREGDGGHFRVLPVPGPWGMARCTSCSPTPSRRLGGSAPCWSRSSSGSGCSPVLSPYPPTPWAPPRRSRRRQPRSRRPPCRHARPSPLPATFRASWSRGSRPARTWSATGSTCRTSVTSPRRPAEPPSPRTSPRTRGSPPSPCRPTAPPRW